MFIFIDFIFNDVCKTVVFPQCQLNKWEYISFLYTWRSSWHYNTLTNHCACMVRTTEACTVNTTYIGKLFFKIYFMLLKICSRLHLVLMFYISCKFYCASEILIPALHYSDLFSNINSLASFNDIKESLNIETWGSLISWCIAYIHWNL